MARRSFILSPFALAVVLLYSYTKRFTRWSHLVLGFAMGIAPSAAWIAVRGSLDPRILPLTAAVTFWGGGFDVLYACQFEFDQRAGLHSIPRYFGIAKSLWISRLFHFLMIVLLVSLVAVFGLGKLAVAGVVARVLAPRPTNTRWSHRRPLEAQRRVLHHERRDLSANRLRVTLRSARRPAAAASGLKGEESASSACSAASPSACARPSAPRMALRAA